MEFAKLSTINVDAEDVVLCATTDILKMKKKDGEICINLHDIADFLNLHNEAALQNSEDVPVKQALDLISNIRTTGNNKRMSDVIRAMRMAIGLEDADKKYEIKQN